jgi:hypothetical protein
MPVLVLTITEDLNELLENGGMTSITSLRKLCRIVVMAVDLTIMFIVTILRAKDGRAYRAGKVVNMVFSIQGSDV